MGVPGVSVQEFSLQADVPELPTARFPLALPTAYCLLPTAYCLLPTAYCLLPTASGV